MAVPSSTSSTTGLNVRVHARRAVAEDIVALELRPLQGDRLAPFSAGSHIDIELPVQDPHGQFIVRQYSLCNDPAEHERYVVGVSRDAASRGGSAYLHDHAKVGDVLHISAPRNHFELYEAAPFSVLVAGGIGITPLLAMVRRLSALGRRWRLYLCARTPQRAAFLDELRALGGEVLTVFDGVPGGQPIELDRIVAGAPADTHFYCCGPAGLMQAFERATAARPAHTVHVEWFKPRPVAERAAAAPDGSFQVKLARSGITLPVPADRSILDVLIDAGIAIAHSCCDGVCGTCETRVLDGTPEHRDSVLLGDDARCTDRLMVCVSRSRTPALTLDL